MRLKIVDFPPPLGPINTCTSPGLIARETPMIRTIHRVRIDRDSGQGGLTDRTGVGL